MKHFNITISGKVQDVFFRDTSKDNADKLGLFGFVKNCLDGTVYIEIEGDDEKIKQFINWCKRGPEEAIVENLQINEDIVENFNDFRIL